MSVIIIGSGGGKAAIQYLHDESVKGKVNANEAAQANAHINAIVALAKLKGFDPDKAKTEADLESNEENNDP